MLDGQWKSTHAIPNKMAEYELRKVVKQRHFTKGYTWWEVIATHARPRPERIWQNK